MPETDPSQILTPVQFLQNRSYQGLETKVGQDVLSVLEQGWGGITRGYSDNHRPD